VAISWCQTTNIVLVHLLHSFQQLNLVILYRYSNVEWDIKANVNHIQWNSHNAASIPVTSGAQLTEISREEET